jgi:hypothetical protein
MPITAGPSRATAPRPSRAGVDSSRKAPASGATARIDRVAARLAPRSAAPGLVRLPRTAVVALVLSARGTKQGHARLQTVFARPGLILRALVRIEPPKNFAVERATGRAQVSLWCGPYCDIMSTVSLEAISARWGNFTLVDGNALLVRSRSSIIDANFGRR